MYRRILLTADIFYCSPPCSTPLLSLLSLYNLVRCRHEESLMQYQSRPFATRQSLFCQVPPFKCTNRRVYLSPKYSPSRQGQNIPGIVRLNIHVLRSVSVLLLFGTLLFDHPITAKLQLKTVSCFQFKKRTRPLKLRVLDFVLMILGTYQSKIILCLVFDC